MDFGLLPPEINSARMYAGPGSGPMLAAAAAWEALAAELQSTAGSYQSAIAGLTDGSWLGPSSASMATAAAPYVAWMRSTATQAEQTGNQAIAAAALAALGRWESALATFLIWFYFWNAFPTWLWRSGLFAFILVSTGLVLLVGLALWLDARPGLGRWAALSAAGAALFFAHVTTPILALGVENHPDMSFKDTALNIRLTEVFTVNIVSHAIAEAMHVCAVPFAAGRDELKAAGLTAMPGSEVASPWIKEAPAAFECRRHVTLELGKSRQIILGEIVFAHYQRDVVDAERLYIDPAKLDAIARLGGNTCATIRDRFEMLTPTLEEFEANDGA